MIPLGVLQAEPAPELKGEVLQIRAVKGGAGQVLLLRHVAVVALEIVPVDVVAGVSRVGVGSAVVTALTNRFSAGPLPFGRPSGVGAQRKAIGQLRSVQGDLEVRVGDVLVAVGVGVVSDDLDATLGRGRVEHRPGKHPVVRFVGRDDVGECRSAVGRIVDVHAGDADVVMGRPGDVVILSHGPILAAVG